MTLIGILKALAGLSWLLVIGAIALAVARAARGQKAAGGTSVIIIAVLVTLALNLLASGAVFVEPTQRGVVISAVPGQQGVRSEALLPGLNWIVPFFDTMIPYNISRQTYTMSIAPSEGAISGDDSVQGRTADGQVVFVDGSVIFALDPEKVVSIHRDWQNTYVDGLIRPLSRGIIRDAVSGFGIEDVYSAERVTVTNIIRTELARKLDQEGIILIDFVLRNISFSDEYAASVEAKQVAEQQAQQAAFVVETRRQEAEQARQQAQGEADSIVIRAQGDADALLINAQAQADARLIQAKAEAEALALLGQALENNPDVLTLEYIEKIAPNIRVMLLPSDNPFLLPLPDVNSDLP